MISENEKVQTQAAVDLHYRLSASVFPKRRVGLLHGQMKPAEKERVMDEFRRGELEVLVSTVVIEVGVDVPNASVMVIEDANRFGLAQLHQLRGRVGRGAHKSFCILVADAPGPEVEARLRILEQTQDGFKIAEEDLRQRGPGDVVGTAQHGRLDFRVADLVQDGALLEQARQAAREVLADGATGREEWLPAFARARANRRDEALVTVS
jgi:ATP-dependent DNA helicase RecG